MNPSPAWLALGSNLGDRHAFLAQAREAIDTTAGIILEGASPIEETAPLDGSDQPAYLNQMLRVSTTLLPLELLTACLGIEAGAGRVRGEKWAARTLDIDLVRYDSLLLDSEQLTLPHPGLRDRAFWAREMSLLEQHV